MRKVCFNGNFVPESEAKVSIFDSAMMYGDTVFEMTRSFNKKQFLLRAHIQRLCDSAKYLRIPVPPVEDLIDACLSTIRENEGEFKADDEHRLMINVTRGLLSIYREVDKHHGTNIIISVFPLRWTVQGMGKLFDEGINAVVTSQRTTRQIEPRVKCRSRAHLLLANIEASQHKGENNWALLLDEDGNVAEGTGANFFIIKDDVLVTPKARNVLKGISRDYVLFLAKESCIKTEERDITPFDVATSDGAFFTGTPFCMLPVTSVNGSPIKRHRMYDVLLGSWGKNVKVNIRRQIEDWDDGQIIEGPSPYRFK